MSRLRKEVRMARVFVPEVKQLSEEKCRRFGEVVPLVDAELKLGLEPDRIKFLMARPLATFGDDDYLILDGSNAHCSVAASLIAVQRNVINLLMWDGHDREYLVRQITLDDVPGANDMSGEKRVFLANDMHTGYSLNFTSVALTRGNDPNVMEPEKVKEQMIPILRNSQSEDYLLTAGAKIHNVVASSILSRMHQKVNYMLWNARRKEYERRTVHYSMEDLKRILEV
jgi:hypothetical protein